MVGCPNVTYKWDMAFPGCFPSVFRPIRGQRHGTISPHHATIGYELPNIDSFKQIYMLEVQFKTSGRKSKNRFSKKVEQLQMLFLLITSDSQTDSNQNVVKVMMCHTQYFHICWLPQASGIASGTRPSGDRATRKQCRRRPAQSVQQTSCNLLPL